MFDKPETSTSNYRISFYSRVTKGDTSAYVQLVLGLFFSISNPVERKF